LCNLLDHQQMMHERIDTVVIQTLRAGNDRHQASAGDRVAAGKQRHLMPLSNKLLGQVGNDSLGAAVQLRRDAFSQWRYLRNPHDEPPPELKTENAAAALSLPANRQRMSDDLACKPRKKVVGCQAAWKRMGPQPRLPVSGKTRSNHNSTSQTRPAIKAAERPLRCPHKRKADPKTASFSVLSEQVLGIGFAT
jgi:hypothetical protein